MSQIHLAPLLAVFLLFQAPISQANEQVTGGISCDEWFNDGKTYCSFGIEFTGAISASTFEAIKTIFEQNAGWREKVFAVDVVKLNSPGGDVSAAIKIGALFRKERMSVMIEKDAVCLSSCVLILAGAVDRLVLGKVGIHRPYLSPPRTLTSDEIRELYVRMLGRIRLFLRDMNVSERLAEDMLRIEPADVQYLTAAKLHGYGLNLRDPVEQETLDLNEATRLGLDRGDFIRRKSVAERECPPKHPDIHAWRTCYDRIMQGAKK